MLIPRQGAQLNPRQGNVFVITTTTSLAFRLTIVSQGGRLVPSVALLTRPGGMFGRASTILFNAREDREGITAVTMEGGNVYMLAGRTVQKWVIGPDGHKVFFNVRNIPTEAKRGQFIQDSELYDAVGNALFEDRWSSGNITLELSDLVGLGSVYPASSALDMLSDVIIARMNSPRWSRSRNPSPARPATLSRNTLALSSFSAVILDREHWSSPASSLWLIQR
jgi:hypothetical protein